MKQKLNYTIACDGKAVKQLSASNIGSIYRQYKQYCQGKGANQFVECSGWISIGYGYWQGDGKNFYLVEKENQSNVDT
jgi:hypothetical protein